MYVYSIEEDVYIIRASLLVPLIQKRVQTCRIEDMYVVPLKSVHTNMQN